MRQSCSFPIHLLLVVHTIALKLPPDLNNAIAQPASPLNSASVPIFNTTPSSSVYGDATTASSAPELNLAPPRLPINETLLKDTKVVCNRPAYGSVTYSSCLDALNTLNVQRHKVYTVGDRDHGLYDFSLPFRLLSCRVFLPLIYL